MISMADRLHPPAPPTWGVPRAEQTCQRHHLANCPQCRTDWAQRAQQRAAVTKAGIRVLVWGTLSLIILITLVVGILDGHG